MYCIVLRSWYLVNGQVATSDNVYGLFNNLLVFQFTAEKKKVKCLVNYGITI